MLSDLMIRKELVYPHGIVIEPYPEDVQFQPASLDLRLGYEFKRYSQPLNGRNACPLDPQRAYPHEWVETTLLEREDAEGSYLLAPGVFTLSTTIERVRIPAHLVARVEGKSSLGRLGLLIHATAGFIDPGFEGNITLEMMNLSPRPIMLTPGMRICQLSFSRVEGVVARPYGHPGLKSKYQGQVGVTESRAVDDTARRKPDVG